MSRRSCPFSAAIAGRKSWRRRRSDVARWGEARRRHRCPEATRVKIGRAAITALDGWWPGW